MAGVEGVAYISAAVQSMFFVALFVAGVFTGKFWERRAAKKKAALGKER